MSSSLVGTWYQTQQSVVTEVMDLEAIWVSPTPMAVPLLQQLAALESPDNGVFFCPYPGNPGAAPSTSASEHEETPAPKRRKTENGFIAV